MKNLREVIETDQNSYTLKDMEWQPSRLTAEQKEERRLAAGRLLLSGRYSLAEIAQRVGVTRGAVWQWSRCIQPRHEKGRRSLRRLQRRKGSGRPPRLQRVQWQDVLRGLRHGAVAAGFATERWTLPRVRHWVLAQFGVAYSPHYLGQKLHQLGWSPQRPTPKSREQDEALVRAWLRHDWPAIKKSLALQGPHRLCG